MKNTRILYMFLIILLAGRCAFAATCASPGFALTVPRFVAGGGASGSAGYTLEDVSIGALTGGSSASAHYSLDAGFTSGGSMSGRPSAPGLYPVATPTNMAIQALSGTKDPDTSIYLNGYEAVSIDGSDTWSYRTTLTEGTNHFILTSRDSSGAESDSVSTTIKCDTLPPLIVISAPVDNTITYKERVAVNGTSDDVTFTEDKDLTLGRNRVIVNRTDAAGNAASYELLLYRARKPIGPAQP